MYWVSSRFPPDWSHPGRIPASSSEDGGVSRYPLQDADARCGSSHDWGGSICWEAGRSRLDIFSGVVSLALPVSRSLLQNLQPVVHDQKYQYLAAAGPFTPIEAFLTTFPKLSYQIYFRDTVDTAAAELEADVRRTIRAVYRHSNSTAADAFLTSSTSFLTPYDGIEVRQEPKSNPIQSSY